MSVFWPPMFLIPAFVVLFLFWSCSDSHRLTVNDVADIMVFALDQQQEHGDQVETLIRAAWRGDIAAARAVAMQSDIGLEMQRRIVAAMENGVTGAPPLWGFKKVARASGSM
jgi:hypothetical protein